MGDKWFYKTLLYEFGIEPEISYHYKEIIGDTLLQNGKKYFVVSEYDRIHYERIDSVNLEIKCYSNGSCDSNDVSIFPLKFYRDSTYIWYDCENWPYEVSYFDSSEALPKPHIKLVSDYLVTSVLYLQKNLGIRYHEASEISYSHTSLIGALIDGQQWGTFTNLEKNKNLIPVSEILIKNYPNPFNYQTQINISLPENSKISLSVYSIDGKFIEKIIEGKYNPGMINVTWDAKSFVSGVYIFHLLMNGQQKFHKCVLIK